MLLGVWFTMNRVLENGRIRILLEERERLRKLLAAVATAQRELRRLEHQAIRLRESA